MTDWLPISGGAVSSGPMLRFLQTDGTAVVRAGDLDTGHWWGSSVLNVTFIEIGSLVHLYFRALVGTDNDRHAIGCLTQPVSGFDPFNAGLWTDRGIILEPEDIPGISGTSQRLANPNIIYFNELYWLYFIIKEDDTTRLYVATSTDGLAFTPVGNCLNPSLSTIGAGGCGICVVGDEIWIMHSATFTTGFQCSTRTSEDGVNFTVTNANVLTPTTTNTWNGESYSTNRLIYEAPYVYALVCGSPDFDDWNEAVGLFRAHESDPATWEEYGANPVFLRSSCGTQDEAAVWTMAVGDIAGTRYAFYEGAGSRGAANSTESNGARDTAYYDYNVGVFSQIFCATAPVRLWSDIWDAGDQLPAGNYQIRNMQTLGYLAPLGEATTNSTPLVTYVDPSAAGSTWALSPLDSFYIGTLAGKVFEVSGSSRATGATVGIYTLGSGTHYQQDWHFVPFESGLSGAGLYNIINRKSGMCMSVDIDASDDAEYVTQRAYDGSLSQVWRVSFTDGAYSDVTVPGTGSWATIVPGA